VRLLPAGEAGALAARAAEELRGVLERELARPGLRVAVRLRAGEAEVRDGSGGAEVVGGPVCDEA
jgi:hypothetical protein